MLGPQDCIFQHLHEPEAGPKGSIKKNQFYFFKGPVRWTKYPEIHVYSFKTLNARASFQHLLEPEACPEGGVK